MVLAHLGGGQWRQRSEPAAAYPHVVFDLCEVIEWTGAPDAPTDQQLAALIREVAPIASSWAATGPGTT